MSFSSSKTDQLNNGKFTSHYWDTMDAGIHTPTLPKFPIPSRKVLGGLGRIRDCHPVCFEGSGDWFPERVRRMTFFGKIRPL